MTLAQVAEGAGMSANYVGTMENSKRVPGLLDVINLARALSVPPTELIRGLPHAGEQIGRMADDDRPSPPDDPPASLAAACRAPALFTTPFLRLDTRQQIVPWRRRGI